jgi:hypothetical protein
MSFRVTPAFKAKLDRASEESGRSLMQEIELRLEQSLDQERHLLGALELGFGRQVAGLMLAIGYVIQAGHRPAHVRSLSEPGVVREIADAINLLLQAIDPDDVYPAALKKDFDVDRTTDSEVAAWAVAHGIAEGLGADEEYELTTLIRSWLGEDVVARLKDRIALLEDMSAPQEE